MYENWESVFIASIKCQFPSFLPRKVEKALKLRAGIAEKEAEIYRDGQAKLEQVREEQQECLTSHMEMTTAWSAREKQRLNADRQRLERAMDHLRLDKEHMETENEELSKEILQQTDEFQTRKEELEQERGLLQVKTIYYVQLGWRSGESTRVPPMWPGFDSWTRRYMWVEFVVGSRPIFCSSQTNSSNFNSIRNLRATGLSVVTDC